jgi:hypothetical protein
VAAASPHPKRMRCKVPSTARSMLPQRRRPHNKQLRRNRPRPPPPFAGDGHAEPGASPYAPGPGPYATGPNPYASAPNPYAAQSLPGGASSPGLAFLIGLIPGVGAVYNAQYVKAIVHVVVFGLLISIVESGNARGLEPLFGMLIAIWYFYMPFEAYHTARKRNLGLPVDDFSSILPVKRRGDGLPIGPIVLIAVGVLFLLAQFDLLSIGTLLRYWPVALIGLGSWMLYERMAQRPG